jgi:hypothetical protein
VVLVILYISPLVIGFKVADKIIQTIIKNINGTPKQKLNYSALKGEGSKSL